MKKSLNGVMILVALGVAFGCVAVGTAQRVGGYKEIAKDDPEAEAAAEFAVKAQNEKQGAHYKLVEIGHAESQVVAGINYRLCLKIGYHKEDDDVDTTEFVRTIVYKNLQREYSLTSWAEENCGDDGVTSPHVLP